MGILNPVFIGSANVSAQGGEEDAGRGAGTALHPSHTSNSQVLWKPGNFQHYRNSNNPSRAARAAGKSPRHGYCWTGREEQRCPLVFQEINPWQTPGNSSQTMDRGTFQAQSESILPSPPAVRNANSCPTKGNIHTVPTKVSQPKLPKFPTHLKLGNSFGCIYPSN